MTNGVKKIARLLKAEKNGIKRLRILRGLSFDFLRDLSQELGFSEDIRHIQTTQESYLQLLFNRLNFMDIIASK